MGDWFADIDWKKWATLLLEVAPALLSTEDDTYVVDISDVDVNLFGSLPLDYKLADPSGQEIIDTLYECVGRWKSWAADKKQPYQYPPVVWNPPKHYVVAGDKRSTWNNLLADSLHPRLDLSLSVDFVLLDPSSEAHSWFSEFILLF